MADEFDKRWEEAKKRAEDPHVEMDEQFGRVPKGTYHKNQMDFNKLEEERLNRLKQKDPFAK